MLEFLKNFMGHCKAVCHFFNRPLFQETSCWQSTVSDFNILYIYIFEQAQSDEEAMLFKKYDEDIYMNDDGTFRTTQPEGIATIQLPQHRSSADISPENKQVML